MVTYFLIPTLLLKFFIAILLRERAFPSPPIIYIQTFKLQTFRDANVPSYVQSCELVHVSGVHHHMHASSTSGCGFVYFTVQYCIEYSSTESLFQAQDVRKQA